MTGWGLLRTWGEGTIESRVCPERRDQGRMLALRFTKGSCSVSILQKTYELETESHLPPISALSPTMMLRLRSRASFSGLDPVTSSFKSAILAVFKRPPG